MSSSQPQLSSNEDIVSETVPEHRKSVSAVPDHPASFPTSSPATATAPAPPAIPSKSKKPVFTQQDDEIETVSDTISEEPTKNSSAHQKVDDDPPRPMPRPPPRAVPVPAAAPRKSIASVHSIRDEEVGSFEREVMDALNPSSETVLSISAVQTPPRPRPTARPPSSVIGDISPSTKRPVSSSATGSGGDQPLSSTSASATAEDTCSPLSSSEDIPGDTKSSLTSVADADENASGSSVIVENSSSPPLRPKRIPGVFSNQSGHGAMAAMAAAMKGRAVPQARPTKTATSHVSDTEGVNEESLAAMSEDTASQVGLAYNLVSMSFSDLCH